MWLCSDTSVLCSDRRYFCDGSFQDIVVIPLNAERIVVPRYPHQRPAFWPIETRQKFVSDERDFCLSFYQVLRFYWRREHAVLMGDYVRSESIGGWAFQAQNDGETGLEEPTWSVTTNGLTGDGSVNWKTVPAASVAVDPIDSAVWSQVNPPDNA